jgi:hypothetical protein
MQKKQDEALASQRISESEVEKNMQQDIKNGRGYGDSTWNQTSSRPNTSTNRETLNPLSPPFSLRNFPNPHTFKLAEGNPRRSSMTPSPRTTPPRLTTHSNHSTPIVSQSPPKYKRSVTTPITTSRLVPKQEEKTVEFASVVKIDSASPAPCKEPPLRKSKSGTWRSFFSRKQSQPPLPDFNTAEYAPPPAVPKIPLRSKESTRGFTFGKASKDATAARPTKDGQNYIPVDKTTGTAVNRAKFTKSMGDPSELSRSDLDKLAGLTTTPFEGTGQLRLDVNIPTVEMERYSIMFEKLLKPQTTLIERRQTTIKKLDFASQTLEGVSYDKFVPCGKKTRANKSMKLVAQPPALHRRTTSPSHSPMTARMSMESSDVATPVPIYRNVNAPRLLRSQTAPSGETAALRSRSAQQNEAPSTTNNSSACSPHSQTWSEASQPMTPVSDAGSFISFDVNDQTDDDEEDCGTGLMIHDAVATKAWKTDKPLKCAPPIPAKALGRCSPQPLVKDKQQAGATRSHRPHPTRTSSLDDSTTTASKQKPRTTPQIGIARKISVVRRAAPAAVGLAVSSAAPTQTPQTIELKSPLPVLSKQPLRPKLVDVLNRKSTLVVLDQAY